MTNTHSIYANGDFYVVHTRELVVIALIAYEGLHLHKDLIWKMWLNERLGYESNNFTKGLVYVWDGVFGLGICCSGNGASFVAYVFCDSIDKTERGAAIDEYGFSSEFINGLKFSGVPNHRLALEMGVPIMLLRIIDKQMDYVTGQGFKFLN
ncbi:ATP-dependent DNA helicase PIF1-like protein [Tanacetum coccineum]